MPSRKRDPGGDETEADGPALELPKEGQVDLQTGDEHEQQLSQLRQELRNRPLFLKDAQHMGSADDPAEQQSHHCREPDEAREPWDAENDHHCQGEFRQHGQSGRCGSQDFKSSHRFFLRRVT